MKRLFLLLFIAAGFAFGETYTSVLNLAPNTQIIERNVGASIVFSSTGGSSLAGASVISVSPVVWQTNTGSSVTSFAFGGPPLGPGNYAFIPGQTNLFGGELTLPMNFKFHAPSIYPQYGSSVQVGTQTYSVSAKVLLSNGQTLYPTASTITVLPIPLPDSQVSGWH